MLDNVRLRKRKRRFSLFSIIRTHYHILFKYRALIHFIVAGQAKADLFKTFLGEAWFVIEPIARMGIYYFLLIVIFRGGPSYGINPFLLIMFGLTHYLLLQQAITAGSIAILNNESILMQLNVEPLVFIAISFFKNLKIFMYSLIIYFLFHLILSQTFAVNFLAYPFLLIILAILSWSFTIIFGTLTVFYRDLKQLLGIILYILMYFMPVIYTAEFYPSQVREILLYNPIACLFALLQWSVFDRPSPSLGNIIFMFLSTLVIFLWAHRIYYLRRYKFTKAF